MEQMHEQLKREIGQMHRVIKQVIAEMRAE